jgi:DNA-binding MarR family transcriptional regulator
MSNSQSPQAYHLDEQVGFILRRASQRHAGVFAKHMVAELTPTRFAAMAKLLEKGPMSQNELGRQTAMDIATIKGVVDRLLERNLVTANPDPNDGRRRQVSLTETGRELMTTAVDRARRITRETLAPLTATEARTLVHLLSKIC